MNMTTNKEFEQGDLVVLKSGGPVMTITEFAWNYNKQERFKDIVECVWFVDSELKEKNFPISCLEHYSKENIKQ